jgi:hypothetical protein
MDADEEAEWIQAKEEEAAARAQEEEESAASINLKRARHEQVYFPFEFQILMSTCLVTSSV